MARAKHAKKVSCNTNCRRLKKISKSCARRHKKPGTKAWGSCVRAGFKKYAPKRARRAHRRSRRSRR